MIGMIKPKATNGHWFIVVATDYFTKWVEDASYVSVSKQVVTRFIKKEMIFRYGIPNKIITDKRLNPNNKMMNELCECFKIEHHNSSHYRQKMNGVVDKPTRISKTLSRIW